MERCVILFIPGRSVSQGAMGLSMPEALWEYPLMGCPIEVPWDYFGKSSRAAFAASPTAGSASLAACWSACRLAAVPT